MKLCVFLYASLFFISFSIGHFRLFLIDVLGLWPSLMELNRCWQLLIAFLKYYAYGLLDTGCPQGLCLCIANAVQDKGVNPDFGMGRSCGPQEILYLIMYKKDLGILVDYLTDLISNLISVFLRLKPGERLRGLVSARR